MQFSFLFFFLRTNMASTFSTIRNPLLENSNIELDQSNRFKGSTYSFKSLFSHPSLRFSHKNRTTHTRIVPSASREFRKKKVSEEIHINSLQ